MYKNVSKLMSQILSKKRKTTKKSIRKDIKVFLKKKKNKKRQHGRGRYKNLLEDEKQKLAECTKTFTFKNSDLENSAEK